MNTSHGFFRSTHNKSCGREMKPLHPRLTGQRGIVGLPSRIGCRDPRSQKRDLGTLRLHLSICCCREDDEGEVGFRSRSVTPFRFVVAGRTTKGKWGCHSGSVSRFDLLVSPLLHTMSYVRSENCLSRLLTRLPGLVCCSRNHRRVG